MPIISAKLTERELEAIREYANAWGETVSNLIRKIMIRGVTFMGGGDHVAEYRCEILIPDNVSGKEQTRIIEETYNKSRRILGLNEIEIWCMLNECAVFLMFFKDFFYKHV